MTAQITICQVRLLLPGIRWCRSPIWQVPERQPSNVSLFLHTLHRRPKWKGRATFPCLTCVSCYHLRLTFNFSNHWWCLILKLLICSIFKSILLHVFIWGGGSGGKAGNMFKWAVFLQWLQMGKAWSLQVPCYYGVDTGRNCPLKMYK